MSDGKNGEGKERVCGNCGYCHDIDKRAGQGTCFGSPPQVTIKNRVKALAGAGGIPEIEQLIQALSPPVKLKRPGCWIFKAKEA